MAPDLMKFHSIFFKHLFILRETAHMQVEEGQREGERIPSRLCIVSAEPDIGLDPTNSVKS